MTKFEKIKVMSVKELAEYLVRHITCGICCDKREIEKWLKEAEDEK